MPQMPGMGMMGMPGQQQFNAETTAIPDTAEKVKISALALVKMLKHCKYELWMLMRHFCEERSVWSTLRSDGSHAWRIYWRIHCRCCWCLRHALDLKYSECRISWSSISAENARILETSWQTSIMRRLVSFASWVRLLAVNGRRADAEIIRTARCSFSGCSHWSCSKCQGSCYHGLLPINSHEQYDDEFRTENNNRKWLLDKNKTRSNGSTPWPQQNLLQYEYTVDLCRRAWSKHDAKSKSRQLDEASLTCGWSWEQRRLRDRPWKHSENIEEIKWVDQDI